MSSVSVIVPNYNYAPYLRERIDSILAQTCQDFELILLDDCSTDDSRAVMEAYRDNPHVSHIVYNGTNSGSPFLQWQKGFSLAQGEYIWIAESDDVAEPTFLEESLRRLTSDPDTRMTFSRSVYIDAEGRRMKASPDKPALYEGNGVYDGRQFALQRMLFRNVIYNASMVVFRKEALKGVSGEYSSYRSCGDWIFWFDVMVQGRVAEIPLTLNRFRQHPAKVTVRADKSGQNLAENARCVRHMLERIPLTPLQRRCLRGRMTKRLGSKNIDGKELLKEQYPDLYGGTWRDTVLYELDKIAGWSGMRA